MNDWELLERYRSSGSEEAFEQLMARHLGLVHATALRRLNGDAHLAEDVAQLVFSNLARKAHQLTPRVVLAGWLYRDTCFTTLELLRRERRRQAREKAACNMDDTEHHPTSADWEHIRPNLDEALCQLPRKDRDALLLRFFEQRSFADIGRQLGFGESGACRRVARAIEKLRRLLVRRGAATTSAGLAAALTANAAQAAPAEVLSRLAAASLASTAASAAKPGIFALIAATKTKLALMTSMKTKLCLAALLGVALITTPVILIRRHLEARGTADGESVQSPAAAFGWGARVKNPESLEKWRQMETERLHQARPYMLALMQFAGDHDGKLPNTFAEVGLADDQFELTAKGTALAPRPQAAGSVILREKKPWPTPQGTWAKVYGYADGHSQVQTAPTTEALD